MARDESFFSASLLFLYAASSINFITLQFFSVPYGRHAHYGCGPTVPPAVGWLIMEAPTLLITPLVFPLGRHRSHPLAITVVSLYLLHYSHRTLIYPLRLHLLSSKAHAKNKKPGFPLMVAIPGSVFNMVNIYVQARSASHYADYQSEQWGWWLWVRAAVGVGLFLWGMVVNIESDAALLRLQAEARGGYRIPRGGWFEVVACPNYMAEAAEWLGWVVVAWSPATLAFFLFTCSILLPRAKDNLEWYQRKFGAEYPSDRKAIIPFIY